MSYSFNVKASTKGQARQLVEDELKKVVSGQPLHNKDHDQSLAAADAFIDLLGEDGTKDVSVSVAGYVTQDVAGKIMTVSFSVTASTTPKP